MRTTLETSSGNCDVHCKPCSLHGFYIHLCVYLMVNAGLLAINLAHSAETLWGHWPLKWWGLALLIHGAVVFLRRRGCRTACRQSKADGANEPESSNQS